MRKTPLLRALGGPTRVHGLTALFAILNLIFLQGCSVGHYNLDPQISRESTLVDEECEIRFYLDLRSNLHTNTSGKIESGYDKLTELTDHYVSATTEALQNIGCAVQHVDSIDSSNLQIGIRRQVNASALPQEWLTGLSLGLIPSWGTREAQFMYEFDRDGREIRRTYSVSETTYNHLIFLPVFWTMLITLNEYEVYKKAVSDYVERNKRTLAVLGCQKAANQ